MTTAQTTQDVAQEIAGQQAKLNDLAERSRQASANGLYGLAEELDADADEVSRHLIRLNIRQKAIAEKDDADAQSKRDAEMKFAALDHAESIKAIVTTLDSIERNAEAIAKAVISLIEQAEHANETMRFAKVLGAEDLAHLASSDDIRRANSIVSNLRDAASKIASVTTGLSRNAIR